ncbi:MAG: dolichol monophosphate mannose synthase [Xanthobacteraceae bacterium]|nr:dolichol monophosphate mannose synthase [Xanthobacteraceae bacterium]
MQPTEITTSETRPAPELSVIVPAYNECANVPIMVERLRVALAGIDWEAIFVDDNSPDGTAAAVRAIGQTDSRVRCIRRIGRRGLAGACLEGMLASQARFVAVIDGDLQHDETLLAAMLQALRGGDADLAVATRYDGSGSAEGLSSGLRTKISAYSNTLSQRLLKVELSDPMSGFFMLRRAVVEEAAPSLSSQGFKILLDIVTSKPGLRFVELPYTFRERQHGESKLDARVALDFIALLFAKRISDAVSFRFLMFCFVGLTGVAVHMLALLLIGDLIGLGFGAAQSIATLTAIVWNFVLNNALTYRDQRLAGWDFVIGLIRFAVICAVGALSNAGVAYWIFSYDPDWWLAGLAGALMSATWNYVVSAAFVWHAR